MILSFDAASRTQYAVPSPVATFLASEPPIGIGLPVITPGVYLFPFSFPNVSIIWVISCPVVYTSGAGISFSGPMISDIPYANLRVSRSISPALSFSFFGFTKIPPLPPPSGTSTTAHFQVIHEDNAMTSRSMYSTPPLDQSIVFLPCMVLYQCWDLNPIKTRILPLSMDHFCHCRAIAYGGRGEHLYCILTHQHFCDHRWNISRIFVI